jgi:hypothetical protein
MESLRRHLVGVVFLIIVVIISGLILYKSHNGNVSWQTLLGLDTKVKNTEIIGSWKQISSRNIKNYFLLGEEGIDFSIDRYTDRHTFRTYFHGQPSEGGIWQIDSRGVLTLIFNTIVDNEYGTEYLFNKVRVTLDTLVLENTYSNTVFEYAYVRED